ncbi:MAG: response regulator [Thermodesulfobacteriota bacterium]|nr:response regulator [Thermodesulfobacteriota bacterium]
MNDERKATILIVDDEPEIRKMLSRHFRFQGYAVFEAENGVKALEVLGKNRVEVVITDMMMPEMNGEELLREIKNEYPMVQRVVITGYVKLEFLLSALKYGATTCVFKPLNDLSELEDAVAAAVRHLQHWQKKFKELRGLIKGK